MRRDFCILLLLAVVLFGVNNTFIPVDIMESRNLVSAREMVESRQWLVPTLNGDLRLEKPPLPTWGAAVVECLAPASLMAQRALSALMAWLLVWFAYLTVLQWQRKRSLALTAAVVLASCYSLMFMARNATWDIWAQAFCMGGIWLYVRSVLRGGARWWGFAGAGLFLGLSFLSKGPVALYGLLLPFLIAFHTVERPPMRGKWGGVALMAVTAALTGLWWYGYILLFVRSRAEQVLNKETSAWHSYNVRPWYYYKLFFVEAGIWCLFWLTALVDGWRHRHEGVRSLRTALVWSLAALVLLSAMPEKKTRYLLPMMVPCALTVAFYLRSLAMAGFRKAADRRVFYLNVGAIVVLLFVLSGGLLYFSFLRSSLPVATSSLAVVGYLLLATMLSRELMRGCLRVERVVAGFVGIMCVTCIFGLGTAAGAIINPNYSGLRSLNSSPAAAGLSYVWPEGCELRPEVMLQARRVIGSVSPRDTAALKKQVPCVLLTPLPPDSFLLPHSVAARKLGEYDLNWGKSRRHHRRNKLVISAWKLEPANPAVQAVE